MKLRRAAEILFFYTLLVILWGAWVRISHSGDGCGESWPLCQGEFVPGTSHGKTWVEYTHRLMSGFYGLFVFGLWWAVVKVAPAGSGRRRAAHAVLIFTITEALLGAKLVIFGLVSANSSWGRTFAMSLHQLNSLLLTGSVTLLWMSLSNPALRWRPRGAFVGLIFLAIAVTGAWAALASTLFPSENLWEGLMKDFAPDSHHLLRLRVLHPLSALLGGGGLAVYLWMKGFDQTGPERRLHQQTAVFLFGGLLFGILTLLMLSPVWMKLAHLGLAHLLWAALVRWGFTPKPGV
ncbi:MAG: COX15/CtaA family protein [Bdellovibrionaceae bacterium]|nr:COX15/CtaA family protein [Pseudobdellovibrionaceae bacterium]MBX3033889.1 COX15/CtaA family protein [Pseudobdellovibrionaceae bacterium]